MSKPEQTAKTEHFETAGDAYQRLSATAATLLQAGLGPKDVLPAIISAERRSRPERGGHAISAEILQRLIARIGGALSLTDDISDSVAPSAKQALHLIARATEDLRGAGEGAARPGNHRENTRNGGLKSSPNGVKNAIPDSRSLSDREIMKRNKFTDVLKGQKESFKAGSLVLEPSRHNGQKDRLVPLWKFPKPPPRRWLVERLIPEGYITLLNADGGTGKSYFATLLAISVACGIDFLGLRAERGRVLYLDFELDETEMKRRVWALLRGLEMTTADERLEDALYYHRAAGALTEPHTAAAVLEMIELAQPSLVIIDSLTIATQVDQASQADITPIMQGLSRYGTVFALDHTSAAGAKNASEARGFGSVFKRNIARSAWNLAKLDGGGRVVVPNKNNFAPDGDLLTYDMVFEEDYVAFRGVSLADDSLIGILQHLPTRGVTMRAIEELWQQNMEAACTQEEVQIWRAHQDRPVAEGTLRNHLTVLRKQGKIKLLGGTIVPPLL